MKDNIRKEITALRKSLPAGEKDAADKHIADAVLALPEWRAATVICIYNSLPTEADTKTLQQIAKRQKKKIVFPVMDIRRKVLRSVGLFIIPVVAFDKSGNRLGRGGGYYDTLLEGIKTPKIGLAYAIQMVDKVPMTKYDVPMDMVITERGIYGKNKTS